VLKGVPGEWQLFTPVGEHDLSQDLRAARQERLPDPWIDRRLARKR
jgi:hypothetical protein